MFIRLVLRVFLSLTIYTDPPPRSRLNPAVSTQISDSWKSDVSNSKMWSLWVHRSLHTNIKHVIWNHLLFSPLLFLLYLGGRGLGKGIKSQRFYWKITKKRDWIILHNIMLIVSALALFYFLLKIHVKEILQLHFLSTIKRRNDYSCSKRKCF